MKEPPAWLYLEYRSFSAITRMHKFTRTGSFIASIALSLTCFKFISCHYTEQFLNLELNLKIQLGRVS